MHESAERLYLVARMTFGIEGPSAVARQLNEAPQTVKNWESRGVSAAGAIRAQEVFGCPSSWIRSGKPELDLDKHAAVWRATHASGLQGVHSSFPSEERERRLIDAIEDWRLKASSRSQQVLDNLILLAQKNELRDEDWLLIEQMAARMRRK